MVEWTFTYEDGTVVRRKMTDDELIAMYKEHGQVIIDMKESEDIKWQ